MRFSLRRLLATCPVASTLVVLFCLGLGAMPAGADSYPLPLGHEGSTATGLAPLGEVETVRLPALDVETLVAEDRAAEWKQPLRFAVPRTIGRGPGNGGLWDVLDDGRSVWRLRIEAEEAAGLAPIFSRFELPPGALVHLYDADGPRRVRPFTAADNRAGELWAPLLPVRSLVIELVLPAGVERGAAQLYIGRVAHAYRDLAGRVDPALAETLSDKSGSCNIDVACPLGQSWSDEVRSVARITIGFGLCTGFLVNNTAEDGRPLFMTARHCDPQLADVSGMVSYWNYENSVCRTPGTPGAGGAGDDDLMDEFVTGATLLASDTRSDYLVAELAASPVDFGAYFLGWDARKVAPQSSIAIHHPDGQEKRISREDDPSFFDVYPAPGVPEDPDSHIRVDDWDEGTTEGGSSGSPLIDATTRRAVGQLHGGLAACGNDLPDWYGAMWRSFELGLREVLDPADTGADFLDGSAAGANCRSNATTLCLNRGRFQVRVDWRNFEGETGAGQTVTARTADSGLFWFFGDQNWEVLVKVLDACDLSDRFWVFFAATTNVEYTLTVTDTRTEEVRTYRNPLGTLAQAVTDTDAFATCDD